MAEFLTSLMYMRVIHISSSHGHHRSLMSLGKNSLKTWLQASSLCYHSRPVSTCHLGSRTMMIQSYPRATLKHQRFSNSFNIQNMSCKLNKQLTHSEYKVQFLVNIDLDVAFLPSLVHTPHTLGELPTPLHPPPQPNQSLALGQSASPCRATSPSRPLFSELRV